MRSVEQHADCWLRRIVPGFELRESGTGLQPRVVDTVARLRGWRLETESPGKQVVSQETQQMLVIADTSELQIGERLVRNRHAASRKRGELRIQRIGSRQHEQPFAGLAHMLGNTVQAVQKTRSTAHKPDDDHFRMRQHAIEERVY